VIIKPEIIYSTTGTTHQQALESPAPNLMPHTTRTEVSKNEP
jgi:hypothetical protein